ncbi:DUF3696 domain-containing protein [Myxococcus sp. CA040A]|uniref:DUF3696 domain-containing protein n=1 Tax=Myxococcus sp. CA040A TaxID=2741738 RepID=UPI00157AA866|nr:hypothetical protein [Myxococcus sp. CA040A]NTX08953.1 hypothetical protein [Myxococcus sp. CA040A]
MPKSTKKYEGLTPEQMRDRLFAPEPRRPGPSVKQALIEVLAAVEEHGEPEEWPEGFFEQVQSLASK